MADEILRSKHAFGKSENLDYALEQKLIDERDILFLDEDTDKPKIGWVTKSGKPIILQDEKADLTELESKVADLTDDVKNIEDSFEKVSYEITHKPNSTLVDYRDKEIRVMCSANTEWTLQQSGKGSEPNKYYIGFKAYAPNDNVVSFKEDLAEIIVDDTMYYFEGNDFAGIDEDGRKYSIVWLPVAVHNEDDTWSYYGKNSSTEKYIGWYYAVEWYDADGVLVSTDCIRINLSNENCHNSIEPFYVNNMSKEFDNKLEIAQTSTLENSKAYTDEKIASAIAVEVVEF